MAAAIPMPIPLNLRGRAPQQSATTNAINAMLTCPNPRFERTGSRTSATPVSAAATRDGRGIDNWRRTTFRIHHTSAILIDVHITCRTTGSLHAIGAKIIAANGE